MANKLLNAAATANAFARFKTGLINQISSSTLPNMHNIKLGCTAQDAPGFEFNLHIHWIKHPCQLSICMEPKKSCPTVLFYINSQEENMFAITLTNKCSLIIFTMNNITNRTNTIAPTVGYLNKQGAVDPPSRSQSSTASNVSHIYPLIMNNVAHMFAANNFSKNVLQKQDIVPTLSKDTYYWLNMHISHHYSTYHRC